MSHDHQHLFISISDIEGQFCPTCIAVVDPNE